MSDFLGTIVQCLKSQTFSNSGAKTAMISVPSRRNLRSESVRKCSTCQSFTRTESPSCRIGTLIRESVLLFSMYMSKNNFLWLRLLTFHFIIDEYYVFLNT